MTATRAALLELATRVERASGPDHVLDAHIHCAVRGYTMHEDSDPSTGIFAFWTGEPWQSPCINCSSWSEVTASLDAALSLVPEGWKWSLHSADDAGKPCAYCVPNMGRLPWPEWVTDIDAATPALALCAAALRALAAEAPQ